MIKILTAFRMCLGMFTAIPLPRVEWDDELRDYCTACLPLVGLVVGLLWWAAAALAKWLLPAYLAGAVIAAFPFIVSGFMHLDGFMDTSDAMLSWRSREEKLKILKDVHAGSFSVVMLALLALFQFAACMSVERLFPLCMIPVVSRCGSVLSIMTLEPLGHSEYAERKKTPEDILMAEKLIAAAALVLLLIFSGWRGLLCGAGVAAGYAIFMRWCVRALGGVSGDLAGFALTMSELCGLILLSIV